MNPARKRAFIELLGATAIWGIATPVIKYTLVGFSSLPFLTYRFGLSTILALVIFTFVKQHLPKDKAILLKLFGYGFVTSTISLGFLFFGLENTTVLDASLITLINPLLITLAGALFLKEHITKKEKVGMAIAVIGTLFTVIEPLIFNGHGTIRLSGNIMILGYLIATAWGAVLAKQVLRAGVSPLFMTGTSFMIGFFSLLPFALIFNRQDLFSILSVPLQYHLGVFYMAFLSGSLAFYLSTKAQKTVEIGDASVFSYLYPLFATPLAVLWLGEKITPIFIVGAVTIAIGVYIAEYKRTKTPT